MNRKNYLLLLVLIWLPNYVAAISNEDCGSPPPEQFKEENNESFKGDLKGKVDFLSGYVGNAELGGKIETTRHEIFAKYPNANSAYLDRYFSYMFCSVLFDSNDQRNLEDKIKAIQEFRHQQITEQADKSTIQQGNQSSVGNNNTNIWNNGGK